MRGNRRRGSPAPVLRWGRRRAWRRRWRCQATRFRETSRPKSCNNSSKSRALLSVVTRRCPKGCERRKRMRGLLRLAFAGLLAMGTSSASAEDALKAKIGVLRPSSSAPVFIAQDKGYFKEAALDIELKFFDAAQPIAVATTSGDIDFGITAFTAGLYNLAGKGTLKVIGGMSREKAGYPLIGYFASNNAYAAGLKTPKDLAGKRVAVTQVGSS